MMNEEHTARNRRTFRWPREARELVKIHRNAQRAQPRGQDSGKELRVLVTKLVEVSRNPKDACWRFLRQSGIVGKRVYRQWPEHGKQRALDLIGVQPVPEDAIAMRRFPGSILSMLYRLDASPRLGSACFSTRALGP